MNQNHNNIKTIVMNVDEEDRKKKEALWAEETKHSRKTTLVVVGVMLAVILLSGFIPVLGKLPLVPLLVIYVIYRRRKGKELKKKNDEEYRKYQEQKYGAGTRTESVTSNNRRSYVMNESYAEYQARKKAEEEEIEMMEVAYNEEQERLQRLEEEWQAQQQILFQELHGEHYDN